jgi:hypothetical protein
MPVLEAADIHAQGAQPNEMIWEICPYIQGRDHQECKHCPEWEEDPTHGKVQRGCYAMAEEACCVVRAMVARLS